MMMELKLILILSISMILSFNGVIVESASNNKQFVRSDNCSDTQYYDMTLLKCEPCLSLSDLEDDTQASPSQLNLTLLVGQVRTRDGFSCQCREGFFRQSLNHSLASTSLHCEKCPPGSIPSKDGSTCVECGSNEQTCDELQNNCHQMNGFLTERNIQEADKNKTEIFCESCPNGMIPDVNEHSIGCIKCHSSFIRSSSTICSCPSLKFRIVNGICIPRNALIKESNSLFTIKYDRLWPEERVRSSFMATHLQPALYLCKYDRNRTACQLLANMCVLSLYHYYDEEAQSNSNSQSNINICMLFRQLHFASSGSSARMKNNFGSFWLNRHMPWIYYGTEQTSLELSKGNVPNMFKIGEKITIIAARYTAEGSLLELSPLKSGELELCKNSYKTSSDSFKGWQVFGTNLKQSCVISGQDLWSNSRANIFYDLFLLNDENDGKSSTIFPIPILIKNIRRNNQEVNQENWEESAKWQLVRRFYLVDSLSGIEDGNDGSGRKSEASKKSDNLQKDSNQDIGNGRKARAKVVRYASSIEFKIELKKQDGSGSIYPPLITITYDEIPISRYQEQIDISFSSNYLMNQWRAKQDIGIAIGVLCAVAVLWSMFKTWNYGKRAGKVTIDISILGKFLITVCGSISNVFFIVNVVAALNWFITYKFQSVVHLIIPTYDQERFLVVYISIALGLKLIQIIHDVACLGTVDIFFIDWERPKVRDGLGYNFIKPSKLPPISTINMQSRQQQSGFLSVPNDDSLNSQMSSQVSSQRGLQTNDGIEIPIPTNTVSKTKGTPTPNVTIWRSYFVANEWLEICGRRRLNMPLHILSVIFLLQYVGLSNVSTSDTFHSLSATQNVPQSTTCRIAIGTLVYLGMAILMMMLKLFFYEKVVRNKLHEFVDVCSVSNISVFIMSANRFGYYIHGRCANGRADVNMREMHELLKREEDDLCSKRGLLPSSDQQTFLMALPSGVYEHYHKLRSLWSFSGGYNSMMTIGDHRSGSGTTNSSKIDVEKVISTYVSLNKFLAGFIEHTFQDVDYIVRDKSNLEAVLDVEFYEVGEGSGKGVFYNDNGHSFEGALFSGLELTFVLFELMLFLVSDFIFQDFTCSGVITFIISETIRRLYLRLVRNNLVRKAIVDERFLI